MIKKKDYEWKGEFEELKRACQERDQRIDKLQRELTELRQIGIGKERETKSDERTKRVIPYPNRTLEERKRLLLRLKEVESTTDMRNLVVECAKNTSP